MKSLFTKFLLGLIIFTLLVFYNYSRARLALKDTRQSQLTIDVALPVTAKQGESTPVSWQVVAPSDFQTTDTTIFYSSVSTASAVTKTDSPQALGYQFSLSDYRTGSFNLPYTFEASIVFPKPGVYFLRAYSFVRNNHLWTEEKQITIAP
jgi:hypothetical protein